MGDPGWPKAESQGWGWEVHNSTLQEIRTLEVKPLSLTCRTTHLKDLGFACAGQDVSQVVLVVKNPPFNAGDLDSIPGWGRPPGGGHGNPLQYPCLENPMDRGAWPAVFHRVAQSWT